MRSGVRWNIHCLLIDYLWHDMRAQVVSKSHHWSIAVVNTPHRPFCTTRWTVTNHVLGFPWYEPLCRGKQYFHRRRSLLIQAALSNNLAQ